MKRTACTALSLAGIALTLTACSVASGATPTAATQTPVGVTTPGTATQGSDATQGSYVALGDSYTAGPDLPDQTGAVAGCEQEVNLLGFALTARAVLPLLLDQIGGAIVNTSSLAAHVGDHMRAAYQTSKAGINALTRHIASRWGKQGVRCNCVSPGVVLTESAEKMALNSEALAFARQTLPSLRFGEPGDLAGVVAFLLSDDAEWINGQVWSVNGGAALRE